MKLIGIAGGTCSGKSTLAVNLKEALGESASVLSFDDYFLGSRVLKLDAITNFEDPALYDFSQFIADLKMLKQGQPVTIQAHSRESAKKGIKEITIDGSGVVIVEGWLTLYYPEARAQYDTKLFVDIPETEMIARRHARSEGSRRWDAAEYIQTMILPGHRMYVEPQKAFADVILDGTLPQSELVNLVVAAI